MIKLRKQLRGWYKLMECPGCDLTNKERMIGMCGYWGKLAAPIYQETSTQRFKSMIDVIEDLIVWK